MSTTPMVTADIRGLTPDEVYFGKGDAVTETVALARSNARAARIAENRTRACSVCA